MAIYNFDQLKQEYVQSFYELLLNLLSSSGGSTDISAPRMTLIGGVKLRIDELQPQQEGVQFIDTSSADISNVLDLYINGLLDECSKHVLQTAPLHVLYPEDGSSSTLVNNADGSGYVILPRDYIRFVSLRINGWVQEASMAMPTTDPMYKMQKYKATRGGKSKPKVFLNTVKVTNTPVAQVDTLTLSGTGGTANISCAGVVRSITFDTNIDVTAAIFALQNSAAYAAVGVTVINSGGDLVFIAAVAGQEFVSPFIINTSGDLTGTVVHTTPNVPAVESRRTIEYYSVNEGDSHVLDKFLYIANIGAEHLQPDLHDALQWLCASKVLQIMGDITNQGGHAEKALEQVKLSFENLM